MTIFHLFQKLDRSLRNRTDAQRWRVTMSDTRVEIFRRPILTSAVTLGALGIGNAPMPVPHCVCFAELAENQSNLFTVYDQQQHLISQCTAHAAYPLMVQLIEAYIAELPPEA